MNTQLLKCILCLVLTTLGTLHYGISDSGSDKLFWAIFTAIFSVLAVCVISKDIDSE